MKDFLLITCPEELLFLQPKVFKDLIRVGNATDGGYAISLSEICASTTLLSLGLGENWTFEYAASKINPRVFIDVYDDTVSLGFFARKFCNGLLKLLMLRDSKANFKTRLLRLINYYNFWIKNSKNNHHKIRITRNSFEKVLLDYPLQARIGLKVDIEGSEWEILDLIVESRSRFEFVLIEIHDFDRHCDELRDFLRDISDRFTLAHLHANNFETTGSKGFPNVFEITLLKAANLESSGELRRQLPIADLDAPNAKNRPDFLIEFPQ